MSVALRICVCVLGLCCTLSVGVKSKNALIVIDVQNCFTEGGSNPVPEGNDIIPVINALRRNPPKFFSLVVLSQDWHCADHVSFASQHPGFDAYSSLNLTYNRNGQLCRSGELGGTSRGVDCTEVSYRLTQTLWPDHCIIGTADAAFNGQLETGPDDVIVRKGYNCEVDSYSAFFDNGGFSSTEMQDILQAHGISAVYIVGLAFDYCVFYTAMDAKKLGYETFIIEDATRAISRDRAKEVRKTLQDTGVTLVKSSHLGGMLSDGGRPSVSPRWAALLWCVMHLLCATS